MVYLSILWTQAGRILTIPGIARKSRPSKTGLNSKLSNNIGLLPLIISAVYICPHITGALSAYVLYAPKWLLQLIMNLGLSISLVISHIVWLAGGVVFWRGCLLRCRVRGICFITITLCFHLGRFLDFWLWLGDSVHTCNLHMWTWPWISINE